MRKLAVLVGLTVAFTTVGIAFASAVGPEADQAAATFTANPTAPPTPKTCAPEDPYAAGWTFETLSGTWKGTITDTSPGPAPWGTARDFPTGGTATITGTVSGPAIAGAPPTLIFGTGTLTVSVKTTQKHISYKGNATVVIQANPAAGTAEGRGELIAKYFDNSTGPKVFTGDYLIANLEFNISAAGVISGQFGGPAGTHAALDYSAETTQKNCP